MARFALGSAACCLGLVLVACQHAESPPVQASSRQWYLSATAASRPVRADATTPPLFVPAATMTAAPPESSQIISGGDGRAEPYDARAFEPGADTSTQVDDHGPVDNGTLFMSDGNGGENSHILRAAPDRNTFDQRSGQETRP